MFYLFYKNNSLKTIKKQLFQFELYISESNGNGLYIYYRI